MSWIGRKNRERSLIDRKEQRKRTNNKQGQKGIEIAARNKSKISV